MGAHVLYAPKKRGLDSFYYYQVTSLWSQKLWMRCERWFGLLEDGVDGRGRQGEGKRLCVRQQQPTCWRETQTEAAARGSARRERTCLPNCGCAPF